MLERKRDAKDLSKLLTSKMPSDTNPPNSSIQYVIENMEPPSPWLFAEYAHAAQRISPDRITFTNFTFHLQKDVKPPMPDILHQCNLNTKSASELYATNGQPHPGICLLDEDADCPLSPSDASWITHILVGGILGDENIDDSYSAVDPDRTKELRKVGFKRRHLGNAQMTLDHAAIVSWLVLEKGKTLEELGEGWVDRPWFKFGKEEIQIPFRYLSWPEEELDKVPEDLRMACGDGKIPMLAPGLLEVIRDGGDEELGEDDDDIWG